MKKAFNINNYLNQKSNSTSSRMPQNTQPSNLKSKQLDYYDYYLQRNPSNASNSILPQEQQSPYKRTITIQTADYSNKKNQTNTARYGQSSPSRKNNNLDSKQIKSSSGQRILNDKNQYGASKSKSSIRTDKQWQFQLQMNINKLKDIKSYLQNEINMLQKVLDETSHHLDNIDIEFQKIKERILEYTSRSLDAAFKRYKKYMTRWSKYEDIEKKSLEVVVEMKNSIKQGENLLLDMKEGVILPDVDNKVREFSNRVQHYKFTTNQVKKARQECISKHPSLKQDKILDFQKALEELCCF